LTPLINRQPWVAHMFADYGISVEPFVDPLRNDARFEALFSDCTNRIR